MDKNEVTLGDLIEKSDDEIREIVKELKPEELENLLRNIDNEKYDYILVVRLIEKIWWLCKLKNEPKSQDVLLIQKLKNELIVNPQWDIYYDGGTYYVKDMYRHSFPINVKLREMLPNSYFHSPECDEEIYGYDAKTGSIIYNLWEVGKKEMMISEAIFSDFHDTGYGIGRFLKETENAGYGDKVPPTYILPSDFIDYHQDLQSSIYEWGFSTSLINDIGWKEHRRLDLKNEIESGKKDLEECGDKWSEDVKSNFKKHLEDLIKRYESFDVDAQRE